MKKDLDDMRPNPNPQLIALMDYAIEQIEAHLSRDTKEQYRDWMEWAESWKRGKRATQACVDVAHRCFANKECPVGHTLGQLAWGAKEACYSGGTSGWLVVRYIADAMHAFGIAFPEKGPLRLEAPTLDGESVHPRKHIASPPRDERIFKDHPW